MIVCSLHTKWQWNELKCRRFPLESISNSSFGCVSWPSSQRYDGMAWHGMVMIRVKPSSYAAYDNVNLLVRIPINFSHQNAPARNAFSPIRLAYNNPLIIYCTLTNSSTHINSQLLYPFRYICSVVPTRWVFVFFFLFFQWDLYGMFHKMDVHFRIHFEYKSTWNFNIIFLPHHFFPHFNKHLSECVSLSLCVYLSFYER